MFELPCRGNAHAQLVPLLFFLLKVIERVRAARVRPHIREGYLLRGTLLQQKLAIGRTEDKRGERAM